MTQYKVLALDLDGTLTNSEKVITPRTRADLMEAARQGVRIVLAPILVYGLKVGLAGVWIAMAADLILRGVLCALRWRGGRWERKCGLDQVPAGTAS